MADVKSVKRVLVVSQYFWPENFRVNELVLELQNKGCHVEVLTSTPNYPTGIVFPEYAESPEKYNNYFGIKVHRVPQFSRRNNKFSLLVNYLSFVVSACLYSALKLRNADFDHVFGVQLSPIFSMLPAILCKSLLKVPLSTWVLDIWPDSVLSAGVKSKLIIWPLEKMCSFIYSAANSLFLSSKGFEEKLIKMGVTQPRFIYFPQWIEMDYLSEISLGNIEGEEVRRMLSPWKDRIIVTFTGNIGEAQDFPNVLKGVGKLTDREDFVLLIIGEGRYKKTLVNNIQMSGLEDKIVCLGQFPARYMPYFYYYSQYLLVSLKDLPVFGHTLPGKVQSYMSSGKPLLGMVSGETRRIIDQVGCGFSVASGDHAGFASMLEECCRLNAEERDRLGALGQAYANKNFRLESSVQVAITNLIA